jgi:transcription factor E
MQINLLKKVVENTAGITAVKIVDLLSGKKDVNEFLIAKKLGLTINQTRNLLYRLSHLGILNSIRKKDKRKGWYIYFWTLNVLKSLEVLEQTLDHEIQLLKVQLEIKKNTRFYKCKICGREATEEAALLTNFACTECGEVYSLADNAPIIEETIKQIEKLQKELSHIKNEISIEEAQKTKKLNRFLSVEAKKKKDLRAKNRAIKQKQKIKDEKKSGKKIKKIVKKLKKIKIKRKKKL